ncbi:maleylacetate reductase [Subtercola boreus]|uniref:Maleylacetate reductase n=1 Tax=Subtercola boreus TaxID=120213 RepID=A0A3E0VB70_9MICO|nr:maleylacetate reductase [Subtercola boreus]RFA06999.1 maleylacetate reductase [Subtercola boreus]
MSVSFGAGSVAGLANVLDAHGISRAIVLTTPEQEELGRRIMDSLGDRAVGLYPKARMHVPTDVADDAIRQARELGADACVAVGGGSTIGLGKAIALRSDLPIIAVPTTYAGSEMTPVWGLTSDGAKKTGRDRRVLPTAVVYDPELTLTLPLKPSLESGVNAIAHAVEALYAPDASPIISLMAEEAIRALRIALPALRADLGDLEAREHALYGSWLAGACLGATTMGLHHKICHVLGGTLDLPHASTHAVLLPHVFAFNAEAAPGAARAVARALDVDVDDAAKGLASFVTSLGVTSSLRELGVQESEIGFAPAAVVETLYSNPRPVTEADVETIIHAALQGALPLGVTR